MPHAPSEPATYVDIAQLGRFQRDVLETHGWRYAAVSHANGIWRWIESNHRCNTLLWDQEDQARRTDAPDAAIVANKRTIDRLTQQRKDAIESIDETILRNCARSPPSGARLNSETAGSMIDRLSVNAIEIHHAQARAARIETVAAQRAAWSARLERLHEQRADLLTCLEELLADVRDGRRIFKVYRQIKIYNDPALTPLNEERTP